MIALRTISTVMNVLLILIILFVSRAMTWKEDKASIIGYVYMIITIGMSSVLMWL